MKNQNNNEIFSNLRNKNIQEEKLSSLIAEAIKYESIEKIEKYGYNLLFTSCLYDNDNAFKFFSEKFSKEFKDEFKKCVLFTYTNKNPTILKLALQHINEQTDIEKEELLKNFAHNCFRSENIDITQNWLQQNLNDKQLDLFISELFRKNNKPYLNQISKITFWKKEIKKYNHTGKDEQAFFYNKLIAESSENTPIVESEILEHKNATIPKKVKDLVVIKKRRKTPNSLEV